MAIVINGTGTITGISAGGLPDGSVTAADLASTLDLTGKTVTLPAGTGGKVLQMVVKNITTSFETTSTSWADISNTNLTITPVSASSKILVTYSAISFGDRGWSAINVQLTDGATVYGSERQVARYDMQANRNQYIYERHAFSQDWVINSWGTTSKTLKIQGREGNGQGQSAGITGGPAQDFYLIAMEVSA